MKQLLDRSLQKLTDNPQERHNVVWLGLSLLVKNADLPLFTGSELQTFQVKTGLTNSQIGWLGSFGQITTAVSMFSLVGVADRIKNRILANAWITLLMATYPAVLIILSLSPPSILCPRVVFPTMVSLEVIEKTLMALLGMVSSTMYVRTISNRIRGRFTGIIGVAGGIVGILLGVIAGNALKFLGYPHGFTVAFILAVILLAMAAGAMLRVKELPELMCEERNGSASPFSTVMEIIKMREFRLLLPPNIIRGLGDGAGYFAMAMGLKRLSLPVEYAGWTTSMTYLAGLLGVASIGFTVDRFGPGRVLFWSDALIAVALVGLVLTPFPLIFLFFFWLMMFGGAIEGTTVPLAHFYIVPPKMMGAFMGTRLILLAGTSAIVTPIAGYLLDRINPVPIFVTCAFLKLTTGFLYWYAFNKGRKE